MKQIFLWLKDHVQWLKRLFLVSVIVIVIAELMSIGKTISLTQLQYVLTTISPWKLGLMLLIGLCAVLPMTNYDFLLNKLLQQQQKKSYILETSWIINTVNNIAGFGGFISIGLRSELYGKEKGRKEVFQALSKILLFLMSGLSVYSLLSFLLVMFAPVPVYLKQYWPWLIGGGCYFPMVLLVTSRKKESILGGLPKVFRWQLLATSFMEWTGVLTTFLAIGWLMDIHVNFLAVIPLFIAASVIGIVSMIPGALGSFDVMMILGLSFLQVPRDTVVAWLLLFRLFYYLIPFTIGALLFIKHWGTSINQRFSGTPSQLLREVGHKLVVWFLYFSGIMLTLSATIPQAFNEFRWLENISPFRFHIIVQFPSIILGYLLIMTGRGIAARVKRAYWPTIAVIFCTFIYAFLVDFRLVTLLFYSCLFFIILFSKSELFREQLVYSWKMITIDGLIMGALAVLYVVIGIYNLPTFPHHHHKKVISFFLFPSEKVWVSGFLAIVTVSIILFLFIHYLQGKKHKVGEPLNEEEILALLTTYGGNSTSHLVFLNDKETFVHREGEEATVFLQFTTYDNKCIVMGDPSGKKEDIPQLLEEFIQETDRWGYQPVFYEVSEDIVMRLHEYGYDFIKMGEEAYVRLPEFSISGKKMKGQRAIMNRFDKEGYTFDILTPPFSSEQMAQLQAVSTAWLDNRREKGFSLGFFSESYLQRAPIAVVYNQQQEIVAFANFMPTYTSTIGTIDLMRHHPEKAPSGSMDYLFIQLFFYMREQGITWFNLGMAPLSNVGTSRKSFIQERIAYLVYQFGSHFYSFQGLRDYKEKYASRWESRYTLYSRDSWVAYVMIALLHVDNAPVDSQKKTAGIRKILKFL